MAARRYPPAGKPTRRLALASQYGDNRASPGPLLDRCGTPPGALPDLNRFRSKMALTFRLCVADPMVLPNSLLDLALSPDNADESLAYSRRLKEAAELVQVFSQDCSLSALDAALGAAQTAAASNLGAARTASNVAAEVLQQSEMLEQEVKRFLATQPNDQA
ncbi:MAG: hypothetical protein AAF530_20400 [Pseudomonadota bacterium]